MRYLSALGVQEALANGRHVAKLFQRGDAHRAHGDAHRAGLPLRVHEEDVCPRLACSSLVNVVIRAHIEELCANQ